MISPLSSPSFLYPLFIIFSLPLHEEVLLPQWNLAGSGYTKNEMNQEIQAEEVHVRYATFHVLPRHAMPIVQSCPKPVRNAQKESHHNMHMHRKSTLLLLIYIKSGEGGGIMSALPFFMLQQKQLR